VLLCDARANWRREICAILAVDDINAGNIGELMLRSRQDWDAIIIIVLCILRTREIKEQKTQQEAPH